jgi:hypothetical protein
MNTAWGLSDIDVVTRHYPGAAVFHPVDVVDELALTVQELLTDDRHRSNLAARGASLLAAE